MSVNTIVIPGGNTSVSGTTLDISALYGAVQFIPAVGDELVLKNITFSSAYSSHNYDNVTDIESIMAFTDNQDTYDIYIENITFTEAMYNAMSSAEGLSLKVTDISPDLVYEGWLAIKAALVSLPEKTVGLDGVRFLRDKIKAKQDTLTAGTGISLSSDTISAPAMTGATSSVAGSAGIVPAPAAGDQDKFLKGDGTWVTVSGTSIFYIDEDAIATALSTYTTLIYKNYDSSNRTFSNAATASELLGAISKGVVLVLAPQCCDFSDSYTITAIGDNSSLDPLADSIEPEFVLSSMNNSFMLDYGSPGATTCRVDDLVRRTRFTGASSSVAGTAGAVPAPAIGDQNKALKGDGTWGDVSEEFVIMKYGEANAWAKFIDAYNKKKIVYCRASSNSNPGTGSQTRLAFMAYVSNETTPTNVEFQYVRSVGTKTSSQPVDQVFVYKLESTGGGTWSVQTRDMAPKIAAGTGINVSYSNGTYTISLA